MISDRLIEADSLVVDGPHVSVDVRMPWYRALPASCIAGVELSVDGRTVGKDEVTYLLNGEERRAEQLPGLTGESWFVTDPLTISAELPVTPGEEHEVGVRLQLFIPYIVTAHGVLMIDERRTTTMTASRATTSAGASR